MNAAITLYTIGHSNRSPAEFLELLREHDIRRLVDVRRYPGSRRPPHFARDALARSLARARVAYTHAPELGGHRTPRADSPNTAWENEGLRAYADHMDTPAFRAALDRLVEHAAGAPTTVMCAEAVYWRCHRQLLADALTVRGVRVVHILAPGAAHEHELNPAVQVLDDGRIVYPAEPPEQLGLFE